MFVAVSKRSALVVAVYRIGSFWNFTDHPYYLKIFIFVFTHVCM